MKFRRIISMRVNILKIIFRFIYKLFIRKINNVNTQELNIFKMKRELILICILAFVGCLFAKTLTKKTNFVKKHLK
jgi:hypothetical protein